MSKAGFINNLEDRISKHIPKPKITYKVAYERHDDMSSYDLHAKQWEFLNLEKHKGEKPEYWLCLLAGRRSGKTTGAAKFIVNRALDGSMGDIGIGCLKKEKAMDLYCGPIVKELKRFGIDATKDIEKPKATYVLPTKHKTAIYFFSAGKKSEVEDIRGNDYKLFLWDETQSLNHLLLKYANEEIIEPAFLGGGFGIASGTAPRILEGWYWDLIKQEEALNRVYRSNMHDNFFYTKEQIDKFEAGIKRKYKIKREEDHPAFMREYRGVPMRDKDSSIFMYDEAFNHYEEIDIPQDEREYVMGIDIGANDAQAISILCFSRFDEKAYLVREDIKKHQPLAVLFNKVLAYKEKYKITHPIIIDTQGGGLVVKEDLVYRYGVHCEKAEKSQKAGHIEILASALHEGKLMIPKDFKCVSDMERVEWNKERSNFSSTSSFHTDILDALLYSYRYCQNYLNLDRIIPEKKDSEQVFREKYEKTKISEQSKFENDIFHKYLKHF